MALRETIRDLKDLQYNEQKKSALKIGFENNIYKLIKKEFNNTIETPAFCRLELLKNKDYIINTLTPKEITLYEASKIFNRILNELYKEYTTNDDKTEYKQALNRLYNELESYFIKYGATAYNMLLDATLKSDILEKYIDLFIENKLELKQYYNKVIKQLYNEFSSTEEEQEQEEETEQKNWADIIIYILNIIFKILLFPFLLCIGCGLTYKPDRRKK